ncbi:hypothetical protein PR202_gb18746 [Eleusine coracana subsp. coracana]|uniref:Exostosin GT47 domain-containing protein n=1 Tax=Eleusine coracana subsp. coracana TaxID=191504 RepID=A0AAV5F6F3_ELECO|nr:hypothetical protein PR202_gb18746 [Eleusine coracana subsp. coracana]
MEDSMLQGCIPVIIQDGIFLPYENVLNYNSFAVRIPEDDIPNLITILRGINETRVDFMLGTVRQISQRFFYRDSILLEAQRQKRMSSEEAPWSVETSKLDADDDVFATFIQCYPEYYLTGFFTFSIPSCSSVVFIFSEKECCTSSMYSFAVGGQMYGLSYAHCEAG